MYYSTISYLIGPLADGDLELGEPAHGPGDLGARDPVRLAAHVDGVPDEDELLLRKRFDDWRLNHLHDKFLFSLVQRGLDQTLVGASCVLLFWLRMIRTNKSNSI